jgi:hypothetical protein
MFTIRAIFVRSVRLYRGGRGRVEPSIWGERRLPLLTTACPAKEVRTKWKPKYEREQVRWTASRPTHSPFGTALSAVNGL